MNRDLFKPSDIRAYLAEAVDQEITVTLDDKRVITGIVELFENDTLLLIDMGKSKELFPTVSIHDIAKLTVRH